MMADLTLSSNNQKDLFVTNKNIGYIDPLQSGIFVKDEGDFYWADGQQISLLQRTNQISMIITQPNLSVDSIEAILEDFTPKIALDNNTYIWEKKSTEPINISQLKETLSNVEGIEIGQVYQSPRTNSWLVSTNEVIIALEPGEILEEILGSDPRFEGYRPLLGTPDQFIVSLTDNVDSLAIANQLNSDTRLQWASPNFYQERQKFLTPNDPLYPNQWHLHNTGQVGGIPDADVDAPEAWNITPGGSPNVVIAVIDDGMQLNHPDLLVYRNPGEVANNGIDDDGNGWIDDVNGWDFTSGGIGDNNPGPSNPEDAHATSVAGVAAARGNNNLGVTGMAYNSPVLPVRIFDGQFATTDANIASAIYYAAGRTANGLGTWNAGAILNNSWGGGGSSTAITNAFNWASTNGRSGKGVISFIATGNSFGSVSYPANLSDDIPGVIAVGASTNLNQRANYSNFGPEVDFVAPSSGGTARIVTTDRTGADGYSLGDYTSTGSDGFGGTSSATPLAAGIGALILARNSNLTAPQVRGLMRNTTDFIGPISYNANGFNQQYGYGKVNANLAVQGVGIAEIQVLDGGIDIPDGTGVVDFVAPVGGEQIKTLRVRNQGTSNLTLGSITFAPGSGFSLVSGFTDTTLSVGESATFVLRFAPTAPGSFSNSISFTNNDANEGTFNFNLNGTIGQTPTSNDNFANAVTLTGSSTTATGSNTEATGESGEPNHAGVSDPLNSVWWQWTAPSNGTVDINTFGSNYDTTLAVYTGNSLLGLTEIASNDDSGSLQSQVIFNAIAGTNYKIAVDGFSSSVGDINLSLSSTLSSTNQPPADEVYFIDDGTAEDSIGLTNGGDFMWLNQFNAISGFETIDSIAVAWGLVPDNNQPTKLLIYEDPNDDGNPSDAVLLRQVDTTVDNPDTNQFKTIPVTPTTVSGSFFVAALFPNHLAGEFPAPIDQSNPISGRSWAVGSDPGQFNINNLGANSLPPLLIEDAGLPGNWLLRADSQAQLETGSISGMKWNDLDGDGVKDAGESGLPNWQIYIDANQNGQLDSGEPTRFTDSQGNYTFSELQPGTYVIAEVQQPGWEQTFPNFGGGTVVIDFESLRHEDANIADHGFSYEEDGFILDNLAVDFPFGSFGTLESRFSGSTALFNDTVDGITRLSKLNNEPFDFVSVDLTELNGPGVLDVTFVGELFGGGTVSQTFTLDGIAFEPETFLFSDDFNEVISVEWVQQSPFHQFDNLVLNSDSLSGVHNVNLGSGENVTGKDFGNKEITSDLPTLTINNVSITEGNSGTRNATFNVTRSGDVSSTTTVNYVTADGTATTADSDYTATNGVLTFNANETSKTISVPVIGDTKVEPNETFFVNLNNPSNGTIVDGQGIATIINDDQENGQFQIITPNPDTYSVPAGGTVGINVDYSTSDNDNTLPAFGFRLHYDSRILTFDGFTNLFTTGLLAQGTPESDTADFDNDPDTDTFINIAWLDASGNWPNQSLPLRLYTANFTASENFVPDSDTLINFSSDNTSAGYGFASTSATVEEGPAVNLDVDGNGIAQGSTDGLLIARYLFGFRGNTLINGAIGNGATRTTSQQIEEYLALGMPDGSAPFNEMLDADGNGIAQGSTDGLLIARYLFGFRGTTLTNGAVGNNATRTTGSEIATFLDSFMPSIPANIDALKETDIIPGSATNEFYPSQSSIFNNIDISSLVVS